MQDMTSQGTIFLLLNCHQRSGRRRGVFSFSFDSSRGSSQGEADMNNESTRGGWRFYHEEEQQGREIKLKM